MLKQNKNDVKKEMNKNIKKDNKKDNKKEKKDNDSSDISSYNENNDIYNDFENMTADEISQKGKEKFFKTELMEKIIKYIKIDDSIKEKQKEIREQMKVMKTQKESMEKYIISYLESINEEFVNITGTAKLTKTVTNTKGAINYDNIKLSVIDTLKKQNIEEDKIKGLIDDVINNVDKNRPVKTRTYIKRTKGATDKSLRKIAEKHKNQDNLDDDDIPQYK